MKKSIAFPPSWRRMPQRKAGQYTGGALKTAAGTTLGARLLRSVPGRGAGAEQAMELGGVGGETPVLDGGANFAHQAQIEIQVVDGVQVRPEDLAALVQM